MAIVIEAGRHGTRGSSSSRRRGRATILDAGTLRRLPAPPVVALSRVRGGTYSATVDLIRFTDGTTAHTDLIRLNPNIDAYSIDFGGVSPRRLAHYREVPWQQAPLRAAVLWQQEITRILASSFPHLSTAELTRRLRDHGYPIGTAAIREHEAIAATQAAIWRLTNGLELDTEPIDAPIRASARIGDHPSAKVVQPDAGRLDWHTLLPAGRTAYLELTLADDLQLQAYGFRVDGRTGRHRVDVHLESSVDGARWTPVSRSSVTIAATRPVPRRLQRQLGLTATLASATAASGQRGHRHYRLAATGPADRDGLLDLRDIRLELAGTGRFRNRDRVVYLYDLLLAQATGDAPALRPDTSDRHTGGLLGPFVLSVAAATVTASQTQVVDAHGNDLWGPIDPGTRFYLRHSLDAAGQVEVRLRHHQTHARLLIGSRVPAGPTEFTPLVALASPVAPESRPHTILIGSGAPQSEEARPARGAH